MNSFFDPSSVFSMLGKILLFFLHIWPFWVVPILLEILVRQWVFHVRSKNIDDKVQKAKLLEIKFPQQVDKTPLAMEIVIQSMWQTGGEANWYRKYVEGGVRPWCSLEIASIGGQIHFYIWAFAGQKNVIESQLYSQYPGIEVSEVPDYSKMIDFEKGKVDVSAVEYDLVKPNPYPIKTYVDYGLDKAGQDEEHKIDPIAAFIEFLASIKEGEQIWFQIILRAHKAERKVPGEKKPVGWAYEAAQEIEKMRKKLAPKKEGEQEKRATKGEQETMYAMEKNLLKSAFDVGMRCIYIAPTDKYNPGSAGPIQGMLNVFGTGSYNGFKPNRGVKLIDYPWQETERTMTAIKKEMLKVYRLRAYFHPPHNFELGRFKRNVNVLNTESLATMFHVPGGVATTPTLQRVASKKSEAPANLPI